MPGNLIYAEFPREPLCGEEALKRISDPKVIENYVRDESVIIIGKADEVVFPRDEKQIAEVLKEANRRGVRVTISGAGTGITGSRVPLGGIVLSTEMLTEVYPKQLACGELVEYSESGKRYSIFIGKDEDTGEFYAIAPPGIPVEIFKRMVESKGLFYPPDSTETTAFLGGNVATNASGARTFHYGSTREYVRRLRVVLPNGDVLNIRRGEVFADGNKFTIVLTSGEQINLELPTYNMPKVEKNAAGYYVKPNMDLIDLFIGSEGTLGVISEVEVRLIEKPKAILPVFAHFSREDDAIKFAKVLKAHRQFLSKYSVNLLSIEFFDKNSVEFIRKKYPPPKIPANSNGIIFFELEIRDENKAREALEGIVSLLEECKVLETMTSFSPDWAREAKEIRHALPEGVNNFVRAHGTRKVATDIVVPEENFDEMMATYRQVGDGTGIPYVNFGHIGNNHLHFNFLPRTREELEKAVKACTLLLKKAVQLGGTVSGEHGVGKKSYVEDDEERPLLELMYGRKGLMEIAKIKHALDPNHILNIGNIVPEEYLKQVS
ncbi:MAG: FAD-binding oxidoreductase [archaeon YNP-LCB-003-016]|nr:FAD-binding oxidoreductase [Candidatus Culexarchaeum yellowstonense]